MMLTTIYSQAHFLTFFFVKYVVQILPIPKSNPAMTTLWQQLCILWQILAAT